MSKGYVIIKDVDDVAVASKRITKRVDTSSFADFDIHKYRAVAKINPRYGRVAWRDDGAGRWRI